VVLPIAEQNEVVNVAGSDVSLVVTTDVSENQNANDLDRSALDHVPVFDRDYISMLRAFWMTAPSDEWRLADRERD